MENKKIKAIIIFILFFIIFDFQFLNADEQSGGTSGSSVHNQQKSGIGGSGVVTQSYQMGDVSLVYSSNGGWGLAGYSMITRSTKKGVPTYDDWNDTFYLGDEELIRITTNSSLWDWEYRTKRDSFKKIVLSYANTTSQSYWTVYNPDGSREQYYQRIVAEGGNPALHLNKPRAWAIGQKFSRGYYEFVKFFYKHDVGYEYLLERIISGKTGQTPDKMTYIDYKYVIDTSVTPNIVKQKIDYSSGSKVTYAHYPVFVYTFSGVGSTSYSWLKNSNIYYYDGKTYNLTGLYYIDSDFDDCDNWRVKNITPYGSNVSVASITRYINDIVKTWGYISGSSLNPTKYEYYPMNAKFNDTPETWNADATDKGGLLSVLATVLTEADMTDVNGDGLLDRVIKYRDGVSTPNILIGKNNGNGFDPLVDKAINDDSLRRAVDWGGYPIEGITVPAVSGPYNLRPAINIQITFGEPIIRCGHTYKDFFDINGDLLPDRIYKDSNANVLINLNQGDMNFNTSTETWTAYDSNMLRRMTTPSNMVEDFNWDFIITEGTLKDFLKTSNIITDFIDMDGDYLADRVEKRDGQALKVWKNTGSGFNSTVETWTCNDGSVNTGWFQSKVGTFHKNNDVLSLDEDVEYMYIDINGDNLPDRIEKKLNSAMRVWYNNGKGFENPVSLYKTDNYRIIDTDNQVMKANLIDMNADNLPDRVLSLGANEQMVIYFNTGTNFSKTSITWTDKSITNGKGIKSFDQGENFFPYMSYDYCLYFSNTSDIIDIDGDGFADRVIKENGYISTTEQNTTNFKIYRSQNGSMGKLKNVLSPDGGLTQFKYKAIDKTKSPLMRLSMWVVDEVSVCDGLTYINPETTPLKTKYEYENGVYDLSKREFFGFGYVKVTYPTQDTTETYYYTEEYKKGLVERVVTKNVSGNIFNSSKYVYKEYTPTERNISSIDSRIKLVLPIDTTSDIFEGASSPIKRTRLLYEYYFDSKGFIDYSWIKNLGEVNSSYNDAVGYNCDLKNIHTTFDNSDDSMIYIIGLEKEKEIWGCDGDNPTPVLQWKTKNEYYTHTFDGKLLYKTYQWDGTNFVNPIEYTYDTYGNITKVTGMGLRGGTTESTYDTTYKSYIKTVEQTNSYGSPATTFKTEYFYDSLMRITCERNHDVKGTEDIDFKTGYDEFSRVVKRWGPYGSDSSYNRDEEITYHKAGVNPNGSIYEPAGVLVEKAHVYGGSKLWTRTSIDGLGRTVQVKSNGHNNYQFKVVRTYYTMEDNIFTMIGKLPLTITHVPFASNQSGWDLLYEGIISPHTQETSYLDSTEGRVSLIYKPKYGYPSTSYTQIKTTSKGWCTVVTDEEGKTTTSYNDGLGRVTKVVDADGTETKYFYKSGTGALLKIEAAGNKVIPGITTPVVTSFTYNMLGQKISVTDPDMGTITYTYYGDGNIRSITDAKGYITVFNYDNIGRLFDASTSLGGSGPIYQLIYGYESIGGWDGGFSKGRLVFTRSRCSAEIYNSKYYAYDKMGRLIKEKNIIYNSGSTEKTATQEYTYNAAGQVTNIKYPDGEELIYQYDNMSGLETLVRDSNWNYYALNIAYVPNGKIKEMTYGNGVVASYKYNDHGEDGVPDGIWDYRLNKIEFKKSGTGMIDHWQKYEYDDVGNITKIQDKNPLYTQEFGYDSLYRLNLASGIYNPSGFIYEYDAIGNMTNKEGVTLAYSDANHIHAVTCAEVITYYYDTNGNMSSKLYDDGGVPGADLPYNRYYFYDNNNMLTRVTDGYSVEKLSAIYYGTNRVKLTENGISTYYFFPQYEEKWNGSTKTETIKYYYLNGQRIAEDRNGAMNYYHKDHLGSTIKMTDSTGQDKKTFYYRPYGEAAIESGTLNPNYKFNDKQLSDADLYYYESRYYNPVIGRFTTPDPVTPGAGVDLQGLNRYSYCMNNPIKYIDPTGNGPAYLDMSYANNVYLNGMNFLYEFGFFPDFSFLTNFLNLFSSSGMYNNLFNGGFTGGGTLGIGPLNLSISGTKDRQWMDYHYFERTLNISASIGHDFNKSFNKSVIGNLSYDLSRTWRENDYTSNSGTYSLGVKLSRFTESSEAGLSLSGNINQLILSTSENKGSTGYPGIESWGINTAFNQGLILGRVGLSGSGSSGVQFGLQNVHNRYTGQGYSGAGLDVKSFSLTNSIGLTTRFGNGLSAGISYSNTRGWLMGLSNNLIMNATTLGITGGFQRGEFNFNIGLKMIMPEGSYNRYEFNTEIGF